MTVIAWDGHTLAADRRATVGGLAREVTKIFRVGDCLVGISGALGRGMELLDWYKRQLLDPSTCFPPDRVVEPAAAYLVVILPDGELHRYEGTRFFVMYHDKHFACGDGRDYALAAMHLGKTAIEAVEIACLFDVSCGGGVDSLILTTVATGDVP